MNLRRIRGERGLSQVQLAELSGVSQSMISRVENGDDGVPLRTLRILAQALHCDVIDLLAGDRSAAEQCLIDAFRALSTERQQGWLDMARAIRQMPT